MVVLAAVFAQARAQVGTDPLHVEIVFRSQNQDSSDTRREPDLGRSNLQLSMGETNIPFHLASAKKGVFATHLLIVLPTPIASCMQLEPPAKLSQLLGPGWNLALAGSDGRWTRWRSGADAWKAACSSARDSISGGEGPLSMLQAQVGRQVLLFAGDPGRDELRDARARFHEIYIVDGGAPSAFCLGPSIPPVVAVSPYDPASSAFAMQAGRCASQPAVSRREEYVNWEWHAKSMNSALKAIDRASGLYYDVAFAVPPGASVSAPVRLKFRFMDGFTASTDIYSESQPAKPGSDVRAAVSVPLITLP